VKIWILLVSALSSVGRVIVPVRCCQYLITMSRSTNAYGYMQLNNPWPYVCTDPCTRWYRSSVTVVVTESYITGHFCRAELWNVNRDGYKKNWKFGD
jgi:hypothetical protein